MLLADNDPLVGPPPPEVPLRHAPLIRVIAQIRFPLVVSIEQQEFVTPFQEALRSSYPVLRQEQSHGYVLGPGGIVQSPVPRTVWRFSDVSTHWRVSLNSEFLALETTSYTNRADFLSRLRNVVGALDELVEPKLVDRVGVRYIDRITGADVNDIAKLVRPEVRGIAGTSLEKSALMAISENVFDLDDAQLLARWGHIPSGETVDPSAIEPIPERSWLLDLDMYTTSAHAFSVDQVVTDATRFSERLYAFFRWTVTDEFLRRYGGGQ